MGAPNTPHKMSQMYKVMVRENTSRESYSYLHVFDDTKNHQQEFNDFKARLLKNYPKFVGYKMQVFWTGKCLFLFTKFV